MPHPTDAQASTNWKSPPDLSAGIVRQMVVLDREQRSPTPPRRHEPICFAALDGLEAEQPVDTLDRLLSIVAAVIATWIIVAVVIALYGGAKA